MNRNQTVSLPPNGGWTAWTQVLACFLIAFCSMGLANSFGIFQSYYATSLLASHSPSTISWIGTTQGFLLNLVGAISGPIYDAGYIRYLLVIGGVLNALGLVAASFAMAYHWIFLSLGVMVGLGSGILYVPSLALVSAYFSTRRPLATGIAATGSSIGGLMYPVLFRVLVDRYGFPWACRTFGLINGGLLLLACFLVRPLVIPTPVSSSKKYIDIAAFRDVLFLLFSISLFLMWLGVDIPFYYLPTFVQEKLTLSANIGDYLLAVMNTCSLFGRVLLGLAAVPLGPLRVWLFSIGASCVLLASWATISNLPGIIVFVILYGFFTGSVMSLMSPALLVISPDLNVVGSRLGMSSVFAGFGFLVGPPIAGAIRTSETGYLGESAFGGAAYLTAFIILGLVCWRYSRPIPALSNSIETPSSEVSEISLVVNQKV